LLADAMRQAGDPGAAERVETRLLRLGRQSDPLMLGLFLASRGRDLPEALRLLEAEHRARPGVAAEDARAWAPFRAGRLSEARTAIDRAMALGTPDPRLLYHAGAIRLAQGEVEEGRALVRRALNLNPRFDPVASGEARVLLAGARAARRSGLRPGCGEPSEAVETDARRRTRGVSSGGVPRGTSSSEATRLRVAARGSAAAAISTPRSEP